MPDQKFSEATLLTYADSERHDRIPVSHDLDAGGTPVDRAMQIGEIGSKTDARQGVLEWNQSDDGLIAELKVDDTNSLGFFFESSKLYFTHADSALRGKVARRNGTPISHTSTTHTVADYYEVMDWGSGVTPSVEEITLGALANITATTAADIPVNATATEVGDFISAVTATSVTLAAGTYDVEWLVDMTIDAVRPNPQFLIMDASDNVLSLSTSGYFRTNQAPQSAVYKGSHLMLGSSTEVNFAARQTQSGTSDGQSTGGGFDLTAGAMCRLIPIGQRGRPGAKGDPGTPGTGSTVIVQEEGTAVGAQASTLNFIGDAVTVTGDDGVKAITITVPAASGSTTYLIPPDAQRASSNANQAGYNSFLQYANLTTALAAIESPERGDLAVGSYRQGAFQINFVTWAYDGSLWVRVSLTERSTAPTDTTTTTIFYGSADDSIGEGVEFGRLRGETSATYPVSGDRTITANGPGENLIVDGMDFGVDAVDGDYLLVEYYIAELTNLANPQFSVNESSGGTYLGQSDDLVVGTASYAVMELDAATGRTLRLNLLASKTGSADGVLRMNVQRVTLFSDSNRSAVEAAEVANAYLASQLTPASAEIALWRLGLSVQAGQTFQYLFHLYTALQDHVTSLATEPGSAGAEGVWHAIDNQYANEVPTTILDQGTKTTVQAWLEYLDGKAVPPDEASAVSTDEAPPGGTEANVQRWIDYFGGGVPMHKAYWSTGGATDTFTAPTAFTAVLADLTALGDMAHGDTLLIEMTNDIPSTATAHINLKYKSIPSPSNTITSADIPVTNGHQIIAFDISYADTSALRQALDIDGAVTGTGAGSLKVDAIVLFDGTLSGKDKASIATAVGLLEERLLVIERFTGPWDNRRAYYQGQSTVKDGSIYVALNDIPARPQGQEANPGPRVTTDDWEAVSDHQGEWVTGDWYGVGNTFTYTVNAGTADEEVQLYFVTAPITGDSILPPHQPNALRIDPMGAIDQIADWAVEGNTTAVPTAKLPALSVSRRNDKLVIRYGADTDTEEEFLTATATEDGVMSHEAYVKLGGIEEGAQVNRTNDELGALLSISASASEANFTLGGVGHVLSHATDSEAGVMSSSDKTKLDALNHWTVESEWTAGHAYEVGDIATRYTALVRCTQAHTSAAWSANDPINSGVNNGFWERILHTRIELQPDGTATVRLDATDFSNSVEHHSVGMAWLGDWIAPTTANPESTWKWQNVIRHSGNTYVCTTPHTATVALPRTPGTTDGASYWQQI